MTPESENFEQLRRLMVLKRYEQPPPGYFNNFSTKVIARIEVLCASEHQTWLERFWGFFETKPAAAGAFGVAVCGILVSGLVYSGQLEQGTAEISTLPAPAVDSRIAGLNTSLDRVAPEPVSSTSPILQPQPGSALFDLTWQPAPASFNLVPDGR